MNYVLKDMAAILVEIAELIVAAVETGVVSAGELGTAAVGGFGTVADAASLGAEGATVTTMATGAQGAYMGNAAAAGMELASVAGTAGVLVGGVTSMLPGHGVQKVGSGDIVAPQANGQPQVYEPFATVQNGMFQGGVPAKTNSTGNTNPTQITAIPYMGNVGELVGSVTTNLFGRRRRRKRKKRTTFR